MMKVLPVRKARLTDRDFHEVSVSLIQTKKEKKKCYHVQPEVPLLLFRP